MWASTSRTGHEPGKRGTSQEKEQYESGKRKGTNQEKEKHKLGTRPPVGKNKRHESGKRPRVRKNNGKKAVSQEKQKARLSKNEWHEAGETYESGERQVRTFVKNTFLSPCEKEREMTAKRGSQVQTNVRTASFSPYIK